MVPHLHKEYVGSAVGLMDADGEALREHVALELTHGKVLNLIKFFRQTRNLASGR